MRVIKQLTPNVWIGWVSGDTNVRFFGTSVTVIEGQLNERIRQIASRNQAKVSELHGEGREADTQ